MSPNWSSLVSASSGEVRRLASVWRFSSIPVAVQENTAEHSFWVGLYAAMIHRQLTGDEGSSLLGPLLLHALTHDLAECVTGDVVRVFKYSTPELKAEVDRAEGILFKHLPKEVLDLMDGSMEAERTSQRAYVKDVVKCADFLSLFQYMRREAMRGNHEIAPFFARMIEDLGKASEKVLEEPYSLAGKPFQPSELYSAMKLEAQKIFFLYLQAPGRVI